MDRIFILFTEYAFKSSIYTDGYLASKNKSKNPKITFHVLGFFRLFFEVVAFCITIFFFDFLID